MTYFFDGETLVGISIFTWNGTGLFPDWSDDFFGIGSLPKTDLEVNGYVRPVYCVEDTDYCLDKAEDYANAAGDFFFDFETEEERKHHRMRTRVIYDYFDDWKEVG